MKKQLLLVISLVAITMFLVNSTQAQSPVPRALECIDLTDPLNVVAGQPYTYSVAVPTPDGNKNYLWFVTQDINIVTAGVLTSDRETLPGGILAAGDAHYNVSTPDANEISLTWQSFVLDTDEYVFVVIQVLNDDGSCETGNVKVYRILPLHAFSLDIANADDYFNILGTDYGANIDECISDIVSAVYDPLENAIDYDFGADTLYYAVTAANFSGDWQLRVQLAGLTTGQTADISWGYTIATVGANSIVAAAAADGSFTSSTLVEIQGTGTTAVGATGETIYLMMIIHHGTQEEGIAALQYSLGVNGNLVDDTGTLLADKADVHHEGTTCAQVDFDDIALQTLTPRPAINSVSPPPPGYLPIGN